MTVRSLCLFLCLMVQSLPVTATGEALRVSADGHWLEFHGRKVLLVGDSVTQGWMELGENFDQEAYIDALARRGVNLLMLWSYIAVVDQEADGRIGYDAPVLWPWVRRGATFDLTKLNEAYFLRLRSLVQSANRKGIVVFITVHDGWPKERFSGHPFNERNGGPLTERSQYVELADYSAELPARFDPQWGRRQRHQYFLERFCERLIETTADFPNVIYEVFNEGEWYDQQNLRAFHAHFLRFFKTRTPRLLMVNDDHVKGEDFHGVAEADILSNHKPGWYFRPSKRQGWKRRLTDGIKGMLEPFRHRFDPEATLVRAFDHYAAAFARMPPKPYFFSEPVPEYDGEAAMHDPLMRLLWGTALGGAGVVVQNDTSFGFDARSAMARHAANRDAVLDLEGHLSRFFNASGVNLHGMAPSPALASTGVVLAAAGREYVVYSASGPSLSVDLSEVQAELKARFYNPGTGVFQPSFTITGGSAEMTIDNPSRDDWVLHLVRAVREQ